MDLLSSIRKSGSRGGVNFSWDEVSTSQHRENYLGHSLMAPVGRWQKGRDLNWYAKGDDKDSKDGETAEERKVRERKEEIKRIKEAEEDALNKALGLPPTDRSGGLGGQGTGSNNIAVGELRRVIQETEEGDEEIEEVGRGKGFGGFVGKIEGEDVFKKEEVEEKGGLLGARGDEAKRHASKERRHRRHRHRSRSGERRRHRSRSRERHRHRYRDDKSPVRARSRSRDEDRRERRHRSRTPDGRRQGRADGAPRRYDRDLRDDREGRDGHKDRREVDRQRRRSRSPEMRGGRDRRERGRGV